MCSFSMITNFLTDRQAMWHFGSVSIFSLNNVVAFSGLHEQTINVVRRREDTQQKTKGLKPVSATEELLPPYMGAPN